MALAKEKVFAVSVLLITAQIMRYPDVFSQKAQKKPLIVR